MKAAGWEVHLTQEMSEGDRSYGERWCWCRRSCQCFARRGAIGGDIRGCDGEGYRGKDVAGGEIGRVVEREVRRNGFSVIRDLGGHGIGRTIHEPPRVPNYADPAASQILTEGLVITVEPIIAAGSGRAIVAKDGWTVCTADRRPSAHYEHTLVITKGEPILLTAA